MDDDTVREPSAGRPVSTGGTKGWRGAHHITDLVRLCHHRCNELRLLDACLRIL
jgi:hypothetical protein